MTKPPFVRCYEGPRHDCQIALVGEAAGEEEAARGRPFVGRAGREVLDPVLGMAGINRRDCYITNVFKFHPTGNDLSPYLSLTKPPKFSEEYFKARDYLRGELEDCSASIIVALGAVPMWVLAEQTGIHKWRGSPLPSTLVKRKLIIPTLHPAFALREFSARYLIGLDFIKAKRIVQGEKRSTERKFHLRPTFDEAMCYLHEARTRDSVGFDIEVMNNEVSCFAIAVSPYDVMSIPLISEGENFFSLEQEQSIWKQLKKLLEDESVTKVGQNITFDMSVMFRRHNIITRPVEDTMVAQSILAPDFPKGLDFIVSVHTDEPYYKEDGKIWFKFAEGEMRFFRYNALDAATCLEALPRQKEELARFGNLQAYYDKIKQIEPSVFMQTKGIRVCPGGLKLMAAEQHRRIAKLQRHLNELCGQNLNPNSPKQVKDYFYKKKKIPPIHYKKKVTTRDETLKTLARKGHTEALLIRDMRSAIKATGAYYEVNLDPDHRLRSSFNPVGTVSGRFSSSATLEGTGLNMQTLVKEKQEEDRVVELYKEHKIEIEPAPDMRKMLFADKGYIGFRIDQAQAENRVVAYISKEPKLIDAFESEKDIHSLTAVLIFNTDIESVTKVQRDGGKKANHAFNYDLSARGFADKYLLPLSEATRIRSAYFASYNIGLWHERIQRQLQKTRSLTDCFGKSRLFLGRWCEALFREAYSFIPQSTVAHITNHRGLSYIYEHQELFKELELLNLVHDDFWFQIPAFLGASAIAKMLFSIKRSLEAPVQWEQTSFVIPVDLSFGISFGVMKELKSREWPNEDTLANILNEFMHENKEILRGS